MTQRERFDHLYEAGKRSTRQALLLGLFIILLGAIFWFTGERRLAELVWFVLSSHRVRQNRGTDEDVAHVQRYA